MSAIYILIGCSIPIALGFLIVFLISACNGQFDDDYTPSIRMLMDDAPVTSDKEDQNSEPSITDTSSQNQSVYEHTH